MNQSSFCENCGAPLAVDARFCETCGCDVSAPSTQAASPAPAPSNAQANSHPPVRLIACCLVVVAVIACVALIGVGGFIAFQTVLAPATPTRLVILPPVAWPPAQLPPAVTQVPPAIAPPVAWPPAQLPPGPTQVPLTAAPMKPSPIPVTIPSNCWFTLDDLKSLQGVPTDFSQPGGVLEGWNFEGDRIDIYSNFTTLSRQDGEIWL
jgi:hypothetical protein